MVTNKGLFHPDSILLDHNNLCASKLWLVTTPRSMVKYDFIESMNTKLHTNSVSIMKPKLCPTLLSSGRTSNVVIFPMKEMILLMVTNKSIFHPGSLLLDPANPCADPHDNE